MSVECRFHEDGAISLMEKELIFGSKDSGWESRFGQPCFVTGTIVVLIPTNTSSYIADNDDVLDGNSSTSKYEELLGISSHLVVNMHNRADGSRLRVISEM